MPLRPDLYRRLQSRLPGGVVIASEGVAMRATIIQDGPNKSLNVDDAGEYYRINCPFCFETRHRLWINHMWGYRCETGLNLFLAYCYNEFHCLSRPGNAWKLYQMVFDDVNRNRSEDVVYQGATPGPSVVEPPGYCVNLAKMPFEHPVVSYIRRRGLDPVQLGRDHLVGYVELADTRYMSAQGRLYIPIHQGGELAGWQARWPEDKVPEGVPKYYSLPGMRKNELLYNYDRARQHEFVVICEGPSDVWAFGPEAVALFGKSLSSRQAELIAAGAPSGPSWHRTGIRWRTAVIMLDEDAFEPDKSGTSAVDKIQQRLSQISGLSSRVVIRLPKGTDPGDYDSDYLRAFVAARAAEQGVKLPI